MPLYSIRAEELYEDEVPYKVPRKSEPTAIYQGGVSLLSFCIRGGLI